MQHFVGFCLQVCYFLGVNPDFTYNSVYRVCVYFWVLFGLAFMATVIKVVSDVIQASGKQQHLRKAHFYPILYKQNMVL